MILLLKWGQLISGTHVSWGLLRKVAFRVPPRPAELESAFKQDPQGEPVHIMVCVDVTLRIFSKILSISSYIFSSYIIFFLNLGILMI